ncbi:MAG: hypothetical protein ACRYGR_02105 [Janthinobacterium lividum]
MIKKIKYGVSVFSMSMLLGFSPNSLASDQNVLEDLDKYVVCGNILEKIENKDLLSLRATSKAFQRWPDFILLKRKNYIPEDVSPDEIIGKKNYYLSTMFDLVFSPMNRLYNQDRSPTILLVENNYRDFIKILKNYNTALVPHIEYGLEKSRFEGRLSSHQQSSGFRKLFNVFWHRASLYEVSMGILSKSTMSLLKIGADKNDLLNFEIALKMYKRDVEKYDTDREFRILPSILDLYSVSKKDSIIPITQTLLYKISHHNTQNFSILEFTLMAYHLKNTKMREIFIEIAHERANSPKYKNTKVLNEAYLSITDDHLFDEDYIDIENSDNLREFLNPLDYVFRHFQKKSFETGFVNLSNLYQQQAISYRKQAAGKTAQTMKKYYNFKEIDKKIQDCVGEFNTITS